MRVILASLMVSSYENIFSGSSPSPRTAEEVTCLVLWTMVERNVNILCSYISTQLLFLCSSPPEIEAGGLWKLENSSCIKEKLPQSFRSVQNFFFGFLASADSTKAVPVPCRAELQHNSCLKLLDMQGSLCSCERLGTNLMKLAREGSSPFLGGCRSDPPHKGWLEPRQTSAPAPRCCPQWPALADIPWKGLQGCWVLPFSPLAAGASQQHWSCWAEVVHWPMSSSYKEVSKKKSCWLSVYVFLIFFAPAPVLSSGFIQE